MDSKNVLLSKTVWGIILMGIAPLLKHVGLSLNNEDADAIAQALAAGLGAGLALYGRVKAHQPVHVVAPAPPEPPRV